MTKPVSSESPPLFPRAPVFTIPAERVRTDRITAPGDMAAETHGLPEGLGGFPS